MFGMLILWGSRDECVLFAECSVVITVAGRTALHSSRALRMRRDRSLRDNDKMFSTSAHYRNPIANG